MGAPQTESHTSTVGRGCIWEKGWAYTRNTRSTVAQVFGISTQETSASTRQYWRQNVSKEVVFQRVVCLRTCKRRATRVGLGNKNQHVSRGVVLTAGDQEGHPRGRQHGHGVLLRESSDGAAGLAQTAARALARTKRRAKVARHTHHTQQPKPRFQLLGG